MSNRQSGSDKFFPGWKMTVAQHHAYFRLLTEVYAAVGADTKDQREDTRKQIHWRAFGDERSAKAINHLADFDNFKAACLAVTQPSNLAAQMRQAEMPHTRLVVAIRELGHEAYIAAIARDKFHTEDWQSLDQSQLTQLRNTLAARRSARRRKQQPAHAAEKTGVPF